MHLSVGDLNENIFLTLRWYMEALTKEDNGHKLFSNFLFVKAEEAMEEEEIDTGRKLT